MKYRAILVSAAMLMTCSVTGCGYLTYQTQSETPTEEFPTSLITSLDRPTPYQPLTATLTTYGPSESLWIVPEDSNIMHQGIIGGYGYPLSVSGEVPDSSELQFCYREDALEGTPPENLALLHYNEEESFYDIVENTELNKKAQTLSAEISEAGVYVLVDVYSWLSAWGADLSNTEYAHDTRFHCEEYGFSVTIPKEVQYTGCSDYLHDCSDGSQEKELLYSYNNDTVQTELLYRVLTNLSYEQNVENFLEFLEQEGSPETIELVTHQKKTMPNAMAADFILTKTPYAYQYSGFYQLSEQEYVLLSYTFTDAETLQDTVEHSLYSFRMEQ